MRLYFGRHFFVRDMVETFDFEIAEGLLITLCTCTSIAFITSERDRRDFTFVDRIPNITHIS